MNVLVTNCGSSSLKCRVFDGADGLLGSGSVERLSGEQQAELRCRVGGREERRGLRACGHDRAFDALVEVLLRPPAGGRSPVLEIDAVGHRVVHGGERFREAVLIDDAVEREIESLIPLAPLHNPVCLLGIRAARRRFPEARHVAVFDTAFHQTLPEEAFLYALPYECYTEDRVRRYGFHGSSHRFASERAIERLGAETAPSRVITCHLGAGCSTAAVRDGRSIDTSMGMTPLEGLVMATRSGDVDPALLVGLGERRGLDAREVEQMLLHRSGLLGLSGLSGDMKTLLREADAGHARADLALRVFVHRVRKYIGAHWAVLGGADAIVFTGGAGENSPALRSRILSGLEGLGAVLDPAANEACVGREGTISRDDSPVALYVIPANEELAIARETRALLSS
ncbi:MAG: acetate/propionate family kinase [Myxococcota bacterium]